MHKNLLTVVGITILFLGMSISPSVAVDTVKKPAMPISNGKTLYVGGTEECNYTKIQDAIDNASDGDTVFVYNGIYHERIRIYTSINLIGENRENTIIDADAKDCPIWIGANYVTVKGFTTKNSGNDEWHDAGIHIGWFDYGALKGCNIIGNKMINNFDGAYLLFPEKHNLEGNIIMNNTHHGITLHGSGSAGKVRIVDNNIIDNSLRGICIYDPPGSVISGNIIMNNGEYGILSAIGSNRVFQNIIKNHTYGILTSGGLNQIYSNSIENNDYGIYLSTASLNIIKKNNFIENDCHATFTHMFLRPINRWSKNYWDNHLSFLPKVIKGKSTAFTWLFLLLIVWIIIFDYEPYYKTQPYIGIPITTRNYDCRPAKEPYDI